MTKKKTTILEPLEGNQITEEGKYLCIGSNPLATDTLWVVEIYREKGFLCYYHPDAKASRVVKGCGYTFFKMP